jgi:glycosyltransferase involved in cell wall biosynthesis
MFKDVAIIGTGFSLGGAERFAVNIANSLSKLGHKITFYSLDENGALLDLLDLNSIKVVFLKRNSHLWWLKAIFIMKGKRHDVVLSTLHFNRYALILKFLWPSSCLILRETIYQYNSSLSPNIFFKKILYNYTDKVVVLSSMMRRSISNIVEDAKKIVIIANPVDPKIKDRVGGVTRAALLERFDFKGEPILCILVGRNSIQKNYLKIISILNNGAFSSNILFVFVGRGVFKLNKHIDSNFTGQVYLQEETSNPWEIMHCCDLLLVPSVNEGLSNIVLESLTLGLPVVALEDVSGMADVISKNNGLLLNSLEALTNQFIPFIDNNLRLLDRKKISQDALKRFHPKSIAHQYQDLF